MKYIVRDIKENCPECECDIEKTVQYLHDHNDLISNSDYHRQIWFFYIEKIGELVSEGESILQVKSKARDFTKKQFGISKATFARIKKKLDKDSHDGHRVILDYYRNLLSKKIDKVEAKKRTINHFNISPYTFLYATYYRRNMKYERI